MARVIRREMRTSASPHRVFEAWTEPERLSQWFADRASGWPGVGSKLTMTWDRFGFTAEYLIAEADPERRVVMKSKLPGLGTSVLEVDLARRGADTLVRVTETGPELAEDWGDESGWEMALAILKLYLEQYYGETRASFFAMLPAEFEYPQIRRLYGTLEGLRQWFATEGELGGVGEPYRLVLPDGRVMSGRMLALTRHEATLGWDEIRGFLELKAFPTEPGKKAVCLRGSGWGLKDEEAAALEQMCRAALVRLFGALTAT